MSITKIVLTGGPCAGKSTAMCRIKDEFSKHGYTVLFISETATELIMGGVAPWTCGTNAQYQECQMYLQAEKELVFEKAALTMNAEKILIVCDRGMLDNKAYMTEKEFSDVVKQMGKTEDELQSNYGAVFHLVSAAKGAEKFYSTANNTARTETIEEAIAKDNKLIAAWTSHPYFKVIDNSTNFEDKMKRLIFEISIFLGIGAKNNEIG